MAGTIEHTQSGTIEHAQRGTIELTQSGTIEKASSGTSGRNGSSGRVGTIQKTGTITQTPSAITANCCCICGTYDRQIPSGTPVISKDGTWICSSCCKKIARMIGV